jgi:hypothetical protein
MPREVSMVRPGGQSVRMIGLAMVSGLAVTLALLTSGPASASAADVRIAELRCEGDPELVVIENEGDATQDLTGWQLQSEPSGSEVFELGVVSDGDLEAGEQVFIQSGPSAGGTFRWGNEAIFRDDDATDYVRIVDGTGAVVDQVNCGGAGAEASPTPSPAPTASPEASPAADVPNGGGAPPISGGALSPAVMIVFGGSMAAAGMAFITRSWARLRSGPTAVSISAREEVTADRSRASGVRRSRSRAWVASAGFGLALVALVALITLLVTRRREV